MAVSIGSGFTGKPHHEVSLFLLSVSIGSGFTGKPHHEVSLFLLSVSFVAALFLLPSFLCEKDFSFLLLVQVSMALCIRSTQYTKGEYLTHYSTVLQPLGGSRPL